ncbi:hypothetical protein [Shewanella goraebulensis]|uniref:hypothetical protein n=1 Tax=Shewanella goraebulensis TaxID=3050637 RepID=UPI00254C1651|nr:hypothetical protein [Shewanella goraebulensis]
MTQLLMQKKPQILSGIAMSFLTLPAYASTTTIANDSILILIALMAFAFINAIVQACCYFSGQYVQASFSQKHVTVSLLVPIAALIGFIMQYESFAQFVLYLGVVVLSIGTALIPMPLTNKKSPSRFSALILLTGAIIILPLSIIVAPISIFSIALCHIGLKQSEVPPFAKFATLLTLITSYGLLFYWLYQVINHLAA